MGGRIRLKLYEISLEKQYPGLYDYSSLSATTENIVFFELHPDKEAAEKKALWYEMDYNIDQLSLDQQDKFADRIDLVIGNKLPNAELEVLREDIAGAIEEEGNNPDINIDDNLYFVYTALEVKEITELKYGIDIYKILVVKE